MGKLSASNSGTAFVPCPEGQYQAVIVDVIDLGWLPKKHKDENKGFFPYVQIVYQIAPANMDGEDVVREDGKRFLVFSRKHPLSADSRAGFYKEVSSIIGERAFKAALESEEFDTEDLIGKNVILSVVHNEWKNEVYANVENISPWPKRMGEIIESEDYTRRHERENYAPPAVGAFDSAELARAWCEQNGFEFRPPREKTEAASREIAPSKNMPREKSPQNGHRADVAHKQSAGAKAAALAKEFDAMDDDNDVFADE